MNKEFTRKPLVVAVSAALRGSLVAGLVAVPAHAQEQSERALEEIIVTAQKRSENLQDVPISVQVLGNQQLTDLNLSDFADYIEFLPTVSYISQRPGVSQVYMRGISSGGDGVHSGSMPSVGVYLDEQPVTTINRVLDVHVYDVERIETLAGPQGTYFGASSQAGTMRIITNKPQIGEFEAGFDIGAETVNDGSEGYTGEGFVNIPLTDNSALAARRLVRRLARLYRQRADQRDARRRGRNKGQRGPRGGGLQHLDQRRDARRAEDRPDR